MTSDPLSQARWVRRTAWFVYAIWALMTLMAAAWIARYVPNNPLIDEWEFIPALMDEEPTIPWLWKQHNEHRFPVPRLLYYPLFQLTHDFRTGCFVSLFGISLLSLAMVKLARRLRGQLHWADAFFPLSLLHLGHFENFRMGYQVCFMLITVLSGCILWLILLTLWTNFARRALQVGLLLIPLLGCGAGGLAFGPPLAFWLLIVVGWMAFGYYKPPYRLLRIGILLALVAFVPAFIAIYYHGYVHPEFHPASAGILPSIRIALQALTTAFGVAASGIWPISGLLVGIIAFEAAIRLVRVLRDQPEERPRALGLLFFLGAVAVMAFGIGWGRSGWGENANMGLAPRYGWIMWPGLAAIYFLWMLYGGPVLSRRVPAALCLAVIAFLPFNIGTGIVEGEKHLEESRRWEAAVRAGDTDDELIEKFYSGYSNPEVQEEIQGRVRVALRLMRARHISYYFPLREPPRRVKTDR
jgi:hypothetical protein